MIEIITESPDKIDREMVTWCVRTFKHPNWNTQLLHIEYRSPSPSIYTNRWKFIDESHKMLFVLTWGQYILDNY